MGLSNDLGSPGGSSGNQMISERYAVGSGDAAQPMTPAGDGMGASLGIPADGGLVMGNTAESPAPSPQGVPGPNGAPGILRNGGAGASANIPIDPLNASMRDLQNFLIGPDHD